MSYVWIINNESNKVDESSFSIFVRRGRSPIECFFPELEFLPEHFCMIHPLLLVHVADVNIDRFVVPGDMVELDLVVSNLLHQICPLRRKTGPVLAQLGGRQQ